MRKIPTEVPDAGRSDLNILIVYYNVQPVLRSTIVDHLYSFKKYSGARCYYLNMAIWSGIPAYLRHVQFDLIVFHTIFLSTRWHRPTFVETMNKIRSLMDYDAVKIALPQDEFIHMDLVCDFINEFKIQHVFSVAMPSEWEKIYRTVDRSRVAFHHVLTGYLDPSTVDRINLLSNEIPDRTIGIGYRAWKAEPWLGRHGFLKTRIAEIFAEKAPQWNLNTDISTRFEDTFYGDDWFRFLLHCRYTIGVEGGASLLDWNGEARSRTIAYMKDHPDAPFDEIEAACFRGLDGQLLLRAISPRQFDACATKTCQVLIEGDYNGVLEAGVHYIGLKSDFSNITEVLDLIRSDTKRKQIAENAYQDIVESGRYTYEHFVRSVIDAAIPNGQLFARTKEQQKKAEKIACNIALVLDRYAGWVIKMRAQLLPLRRLLVTILLKTSFGQKLKQDRQNRAPKL